MHQIIKISRDSTLSAHLISGSYELYAFAYGIKKFLGRLGAIVLYLIVVVPLFLVALLAIPVLKYLSYRLRNSIIKSTDELVIRNLTPENYREIRLGFDKLTANIEAVKKVKYVNLDNKHLFVRTVLKEFNSILDALLYSHNKVKADLNKLDESPIGLSIFTQLGEEELWNKRNKAAAYIM